MADGKWPIARPVALFGFSFQLSAFQLLPKCGFGWHCPAFQGSRFEVQGSKYRIDHKHSQYSPPLPPPSGWSGGTLDNPWTYPGTIDHLPSPLFEQASLSRSVSCGFSALWRYPGLEVGSWVLDVPFLPLVVQGSPLACGVQYPSDLHDFHAFAACSPGVVGTCVRLRWSSGRRSRSNSISRGFPGPLFRDRPELCLLRSPA